MSRKRRPDDPFEYALGEGDDIGDFLAQVKNLCRFSDCLTDEETDRFITIESFEKTRALALLDVFSDMSNKDKAEKAGVAYGTSRKMRATPLYSRVHDRIIDLAKQCASPATMMEAAERFEPVLVNETLNTALFGSGRDKMHAVEEFTGRISAKKGRDAGKIEIRLPDGFLRQIKEAQEIQTEALMRPAAIDVPFEPIEASVVRVPSYDDPEE